MLWWTGRSSSRRAEAAYSSPSDLQLWNAETSDAASESSHVVRKIRIRFWARLKQLVEQLFSRFHESNLMGPSNLSTVVTPSLVWQPSTSADHTAAIIDAQHANRTLQCLITNAFVSPPSFSCCFWLLAAASADQQSLRHSYSASFLFSDDLWCGSNKGLGWVLFEVRLRGATQGQVLLIDHLR